MTDTTLLKIKVLESGKYPKLKDLAEDIGLSRQALSQKMNNRNGAKFTIPEAKALKEKLNLSDADLVRIFFQ